MGLQISEFHASCQFNVKDFKNLMKRMQSLLPYRHCPHISAISTLQFQHEAFFTSFTNFIPEVISIGKGKAIPLQAWTGPEGSRRLRLPDVQTVGT